MASEPVTALRSATPQDADLIRDLVRAAYAKWIAVLGREPLPMKVDYERAVLEHQIDVLSIDGNMVGLIEMMLRSDHLWIENIAVRPDSQGMGLGRQLMLHAERKAAAAGHTEIRLLTSAAFEANVALYTRLGYRIERREPFMGGTTIYMSKKLDRQRGGRRYRWAASQDGTASFSCRRSRLHAAARQSAVVHCKLLAGIDSSRS